ncbi:MAG: phosphomannomutase/phosphoglucomutase [Nanoarchaeota archaeon]
MSIFHDYDVRGVYPKELNEKMAYLIGKALVVFFKHHEYVVGRDARLSSPVLTDALVKGITDQGGDVVLMGQCTTPEYNWVCAHYLYKAGVMVTASHNPKEYNGFKINGPHATPIGYDNGLNVIEKLICKKFPKPARKGKTRMHDYTTDYVHFLKKLVHQDLHTLRVVVDESNGTEGRVARHLFHELGLIFHSINYKPEGDFPHHSPNPLNPGSQRQIEHEVIRRKADLGILFDADADRVLFIDETGRAVEPNLILALLTHYYARPGDAVVYDATTSRIVPETLAFRHIKGIQSKVGRSHILHHMKKSKAILGGESSGHYFFKEVYGTDSGILCALKIMEMLAHMKKPLTYLLERFQTYAKSGDVSIPLHKESDKKRILRTVERTYKKGAKVKKLDGLTFEYKDWWFNIRASNTEPILRLTIETKDWAFLEHKKEEILRVIHS